MPQLRLALRTLFKTPLVTLVAVLSLALGIGANSAIFSLYHQMLLRPLPVPRPNELVNLGAPGPKSGSNSCSNIGSCDDIFSYPMYRDLERVQASFSGLASHRDFGATIGYQGTTLSGDGLLVSGSYFPVLELTPALGRLFTPDDDKVVGSQFVAVLSHDYWRTRFELNPGILNQALIVNGQALTVIGVAPQGFQGTTLGTQYRRVRPTHDAWIDDAGIHWLREPPSVLGVSVRAAQAGRVDRAGTDRHQWSVSRDHQRRRGAAAEGRERPDHDPLQGQDDHRRRRPARPERCGSRGQRPADDPLRRHGNGAAHRLRQHRESLARSRGWPIGRDGRAPLDWRQPQAADRAAAHRVVPAGRAGRDRRPAGGEMDARPDRDHSSARRRRTRAIQDGPDDAAVWRGDSRGHGNRVWPVPGASQHQARSGHHHQEPGGAGRRRTGGKTIPDDARDRADRDVDGAARASRAVREEPDERQSSRPGSQDRSPGGLQRLAGADCLLDRTNACPLRAHRGRADVHARCHRRGRDHRAAHRRRQLGQQPGGGGISGGT